MCVQTPPREKAEAPPNFLWGLRGSLLSILLDEIGPLCFFCFFWLVVFVCFFGLFLHWGGGGGRNYISDV